MRWFYVSILFLLTFFSQANDSTLVITTLDQVDTVIINDINGVVYRNQYFIQGEITQKRDDSLIIHSSYVSNKILVDTVISVSYSDISAIVYRRALKKPWANKLFTKNKLSKATRIGLLVLGATSIAINTNQNPTIGNYALPLVLIPVGLLYHILIEFESLQTKKIKLKKGISRIE